MIQELPPAAKAAPWQPLFEGESAQRLRRELEIIRQRLEQPSPLDERLGDSLALGRSGICLFHAYAHLADPEGGHGNLAAGWLTQIEAGMPATGEGSFGLYDGTASVAWVATHLARLMPTDIRPSRALLSWARSGLTARLVERPGDLETPYDLFSGLAGLAMLAVEMDAEHRQPLLGAAIDRLESIADRNASGASWRTLPQHSGDDLAARFPHGVYSFGVAHGMASVLWLLAVAAQCGVREEQAVQLLEAGMSWLLAHASESASFPEVLPAGATPDPRHSRLPRLAWCRGNLGLGAALMAIGQLRGVEGWSDFGYRIARREAERTLPEGGIVDPGICHGAAGVGHLFHRLYRATGDTDFATAARRWITHAWQLRRERPESGGYDGLGHRPRGFLFGEAGVGLVLLAALTSVEPAWDRLLCASFPSG